MVTHVNPLNQSRLPIMNLTDIFNEFAKCITIGYLIIFPSSQTSNPNMIPSHREWDSMPGIEVVLDIRFWNGYSSCWEIKRLLQMKSSQG